MPTANTDKTIADQIRAEIAADPFLISQHGLMRKLKLTRHHLLRICEAEGIKIPKTISSRLRARLNKNRHNCFKGWSINPPKTT